jgi:Spy/CpxP family protein refolding chaperone
MKTSNLKKLTLTLVVFMLSLNLGYSQQTNNNQNRQLQHQPMILHVIPNLTQTQKNKIISYHNQMIQKNMQLQADMQVKRAQLHALMIKDSDTKEKEDIAKQMSDIRYNMQVNRIEYHDNVRALLTDSQKIVFDQHSMKHQKRMLRKSGKKHMKRYGNCPYRSVNK